jgi:hypothetical protein
MLKGDYIDVMPVGINEEAESVIRIYPNPNKGSFRLNNPYKKELQAAIYSTFGQLIYDQMMKPGNNFAELAGVSKGIYIICYKDKDGIKLGFERLIVY